jgi:hypothetical protein
MIIIEATIEGLKELSAENQQEVLDFVEFLRHRWQTRSNSPAESEYPLRGTVLRYDEPFEPAVPVNDWHVLA